MSSACSQQPCNLWCYLLLLLLLLRLQVRVGVLDKEAAELRDEVSALQQRLATFDEAAVRDFAAKVGDFLSFGQEPKRQKSTSAAAAAVPVVPLLPGDAGSLCCVAPSSFHAACWGATMSSTAPLLLAVAAFPPSPA
jgi:hypothetical protein